MRTQSILSLLMLSAVASTALAQVASLPPLPMPGDNAPGSAPALPSPMTPPAMPAAAAPSAPLAPRALPELPAQTAPAAPAAPGSANGLPSMPQTAASTSPAATAPAKSTLGTVLNGIAQRSVNSVEAASDAAAEAPKVYSYGTSSISILFLPMQIDRMKTTIRNYENTAKDKTATLVTPEPTVVAPTEVIAEPPSYPVFYLASIAYDAPNDWSLWVSGHKITSRKNDTDLTVIRVTRDSATFSWMPTYSSALTQRHTRDLFAPTDSVKNKLTNVQGASLDEGNGLVTFTLKQNQSFTVGYFSTFEGFIESPKLSPLVVAPVAGAPGAPGAAVAGGPPNATNSAALVRPPVIGMNPASGAAGANGPGQPVGARPPGMDTTAPAGARPTGPLPPQPQPTR